jgi:hypothetical protein
LRNLVGLPLFSLLLQALVTLGLRSVVDLMSPCWSHCWSSRTRTGVGGCPGNILICAETVSGNGTIRNLSESMRGRFRYTFAVGATLLLAVVTYIVLGIAEIGVTTAAYQVAPPIAYFLYTALMFHGYQDTEDAEIPPPAKIADDNSIGADVNEANQSVGEPTV